MDPTSHGRVLVVDDSRDLREAAAALLRASALEVETAVDGLDAIEKLEGGFRPDVILLDVVMPRLDGFAFRRWQRSDPRFALTPVVVLSGEYNPTRAERLIGLSVLSKPPDPDLLVKIIQHHVRRGRL
jgi:CheY-like chemotaxis protein